MFRILTNQPTPEYWLICDRPDCGVHCRATIPACHTAEEAASSQTDFMRAVMRDGWAVSLQMTLCPGHAQSMRDAAALARAGLGGGQAEIVRPSAKELVQINRGRGREPGHKSS